MLSHPLVFLGGEFTPLNMISSFVDLLENGTFSDFSLNVNGRTLRLHKAIVEERSDYFKECFKNDLNIKYVAITIDESYSCFIDIVLKWIYSDPQFYISDKSFKGVVYIALTLKISSLLSYCYKWMLDNLRKENAVEFLLHIDTMYNQLPSLWFEAIYNEIMLNLEYVERDFLTNMRFDHIKICLQNESLLKCTYRMCLFLSECLIKCALLSEKEINELFELYIRYDWPVNIYLIVHNYNESKGSLLLEFCARHFREIPPSYLCKFPHRFLCELLKRSDINAPNIDFVRGRVQILTGSSIDTQKQLNRELWQSFISDGSPRHFSQAKVPAEKLRCFVIGSAFIDVLLDVKKTLAKNGIKEENIYVFNADSWVPYHQLMFLFDSIFIFTHYQLQNPSVICSELLLFLKNGGSIVYCHGFSRNDDWGCGNSGLLKYLPFTRGNMINLSGKASVEVINDEANIMKDVTYVEPGKFSPRIDLKLEEDSFLIARYSDGIPLIGCKISNFGLTKGVVIGINFYPVTSRVHRTGYNPDQEFDNVFSRAVISSVGFSQ